MIRDQQEAPDVNQAEPAQQNAFQDQNAHWWEGGQKADTGAEFAPRKLNTQLDKLTRKQSGRRSYTAHGAQTGAVMSRRVQQEIAPTTLPLMPPCGRLHLSRKRVKTKKPKPAWLMRCKRATCSAKSVCAVLLT